MNQRPFWAFLPYINNRTAWKPVKFPAILIIPFGATDSGTPAAQSAPASVTVSILDTVRRNRISGPFIGESYFPNRELFTLSLNSIEIAKRQLDVSDFVINGDTITIINSDGLSGEVPYIANSLYYDLSSVAIDVENLDSGRYQLSYSASIYKRVYDSTGFLVCVKADEFDSIMNFTDFVHPGEVIDEMKKTTPSIWFSNTKLSEEPLITLYKPLSDSLQNVYDEQSLLGRINFVNNIFPETVPYLGRILGWEIPYFPKSLDQLRRSVLRTTTEFQKNRGSYKGIKELFDLFGFNILIRNLWFDTDNKTLLEPQYGGSNGIDLIDATQFDILEANLIAPGFYQNSIRLLKRPSSKSEYDNFTTLGSDLTIEAFAVEIGSPSQIAIETYLTQFNLGIDPTINETHTGFINNDLIILLYGNNVYASQSILINSDGNIISNSQIGARKIFNESELSINPINPSINVTLDGGWTDENIALYIFTMYKTQTVVPNDDLSDKRSNYFDIRLASIVDASLPANIILDYALDFLYRIKAFHSLLRRIFTTINIEDVYLVGDYCYGPGLSRKSDSDIGQQQVPPAIIPTSQSDDCSEQDATILGYKESDIVYRDKITAGFIEEWIAYTNYDNREYQSSQLLNILPQYPNNNRSLGVYNEYGQDAFINSYYTTSTFSIETPGHYVNQNVGRLNVEYFNYYDGYFKINNRYTGFRHNDTLHHYEEYTPAPDLSVREPICFKGRVNDELSISQHIPFNEFYAPGPCGIKMGFGAYFTTPRQSIIVRGGVENRSVNSMTLRPIISSFRVTSGELFDDYWDEIHSNITTSPVKIIGDCDVVLHYWNRPEPLDATWDSAAIQITNLGIQKTDMHFPGTRFISMSNYNGNFISDSYELRPWDQDICNQTLNPRIEIGTDENEYLVFDYQPYSFVGNGIEADIPMLGLPTTSTIAPDQVVHAIYSEFADEDNEGLCLWDSEIADRDGVFDVPNLDASGGTSGTEDAIFRSAVYCDGVLTDYADGYPCLVGVFTATPDIDGPYFLPMATPPTEYLFKLMSGIKNGSIGLRLDCDCTIIPCGPVDSDNFTECGVDSESDVLETDSRLVLPETMRACGLLMNGSIQSMFELIDV